MQYKNFVKYFILLTFLVFLILQMMYIVINPNQIYNFSLTKYKFFYTKEYSRKQYELLKKTPYTLVFGTSQSHMIGSKMMGENVLNFQNLYAEPGDILNFLYQLDNTQLHNIKQIIFLIDLRAGAVRIDTNLLDYHKRTNKYLLDTLNIEKLKRIFLDLKYNFTTFDAYLESDGSIRYLDPAKHINMILQYRLKDSLLLKYNDRLINDIIKINSFAKSHHIKIKYITPVTNDKYFHTINLSSLYNFYYQLLKNGINNISLYYFIDNLSNKINENGEYITFVEQDHLNQKHVDLWLKNYILNDDDEFLIKDIKKLDTMFSYYQKIQENIQIVNNN